MLLFLSAIGETNLVTQYFIENKDETEQIVESSLLRDKDTQPQDQINPAHKESGCIKTFKEAAWRV